MSGGCALYVHIPFCVKKCAYCDFASWPGRERDWARYLNALEQEFRDAFARYGKMRISTVFVGGGTPSLLPADAVMRILAMTRARFSLDDQAEITVECNPGTLSQEKLTAYRDSGVNRLSIGVQAVQPRLLALLGRIHSAEDAEQAFRAAREVGFQNINLDLMYALPGQTMAEWVESIQFALRLMPEHLSLYSLILEPGTPLTQKVERRELIAPEDEQSIQMQRAAQRMLQRRGYGRYEISNYAKPGCACKHNLTYWNRGNYLGLGCAAHSMMHEVRFENTSSLDEYLSGVREVSRRAIPPAEAREEAILLGTRMTSGIDLSLVRDKRAQVDRLEKGGFISTSGGRLTLTDRGLEVQSAIVAELV